MPPKSIFRHPGARHFQLVHRSQRDPLIHDPEAGQHVLKAFVRRNDKKGKSRADLEASMSPSELEGDIRNNVGEAAAYGIYYDDTEYDYMQHLRTVGVHEDGVESMLVDAPTTSRRTQAKGKNKETFELDDLLSDLLPSASELPRNFESQENVPSSISGFQPDMNPHLRQVLEALEDDAFVDDETDESFFGELVAGGEREQGEGVDFDFYEDAEGRDGDVDDESWERQFARFRLAQAKGDVSSHDSEDDFSEGGDTIGNLPPKLPVIGGKRRRKGNSDASGYSMSSSSMFRTEALLTLDDRFDQIIDAEYASEEEEEDDVPLTDTLEDAPDLITSRADFNEIMDDFLNNYELLGKKIKPVLSGENGAQKLETLRTAMGRDDRVRILEEDSDRTDEEEILSLHQDKNDQWDCETILSTYSNLENHPRIIGAQDYKLLPKSRSDRRSGQAVADDKSNGSSQVSKQMPMLQDISEEESDQSPVRMTVTRPRDESKEDKKVRKQAVKAERRSRRVEKKIIKDTFAMEVRKQSKNMSHGANLGLRKL